MITLYVVLTFSYYTLAPFSFGLYIKISTNAARNALIKLAFGAQTNNTPPDILSIFAGPAETVSTAHKISNSHYLRERHAERDKPKLGVGSNGE